MCCSRGMAGTMTPDFLEGKVDANGTTFQEAATAVGYGGSSHKVRHYAVVMLAAVIAVHASHAMHWGCRYFCTERNAL